MIDRQLSNVVSTAPSRCMLNGDVFAQTFSFDSVGNRTYSNENGYTTYDYNLAGEVTVMNHEGWLITHTYDANGNLTDITRANIGPVEMGYDKENRQISHSFSGTVVTYSYSGDGLKRSEVSPDNSTDPPGLSITTLVWDGSEYLQGRED